MSITNVGAYSEVSALRFQRTKSSTGETADSFGSFAEKINAFSAMNTSQIPETEKSAAAGEKLTPLGMGFANAGGMGYGMTASLVTSDETDDVIIRVKLAKGRGSNETIDVNLSEFDPQNATAVEMFAYCQYKDAMGEGSNNKWGSWNAVKSVISPADGMDFGSIDNIMNEKRNWTAALNNSSISLKNQKTGEVVSAAELLKMFIEKKMRNKKAEM